MRTAVYLHLVAFYASVGGEEGVGHLVFVWLCDSDGAQDCGEFI